MSKHNYGKSELPRLQFEVTANMKRRVEEKCFTDCLEVKAVGTELFERWLNGGIKVDGAAKDISR